MSKKSEQSTLTELTKNNKLHNTYVSITPQVDQKSKTEQYRYSKTKYLITTEAPKPSHRKLVYGDYGEFQKWWFKRKRKTRTKKHKDIVRLLATCPLSVDRDKKLISQPSFNLENLTKLSSNQISQLDGITSEQEVVL